MNESRLTQRGLIAWLRETHDIRVSPRTVHGWIQQKCPLVPGPGKPRFNGPKVFDWLQGARLEDPIVLMVRDRMLKRRYEGAG